jgi:exportin-7
VVSLPATQFIVANHSAACFGFLEAPGNGRERTRFYYTVTRLLLQGGTTSLNSQSLSGWEGGGEEAFTRFLHPLTLTYNALTATGALTRNNESMLALAGAARDLRGVAQACTTSRAYSMLFDFLHPHWFHLLTQALSTWADTPAVCVEVLRKGKEKKNPLCFILFCEMVR